MAERPEFPEIIPIEELAKLYKRAKTNEDKYMLEVAENALQNAQVAEAAMFSMEMAENILYQLNEN